MNKFILLLIIGLFFTITGSAQSCLPEGITFTTQAQIDDLKNVQSELTQDITISPDSIYFDYIILQSVNLINNSTQPITLISVQDHAYCNGWMWEVIEMTCTLPQIINPGFTETITIWVECIIKVPTTEYLHSTIEIVSSVGTQYCHIFLDPDLISAVDKKTREFIRFYPNPVKDNLIIDTDEPQPDGRLTIFSLNGQQVLQQEITEPNTILDVSHLSPGIYMVKMVGEKGVHMAKFVKQ